MLESPRISEYSFKMTVFIQVKFSTTTTNNNKLLEKLKDHADITIGSMTIGLVMSILVDVLLYVQVGDVNMGNFSECGKCTLFLTITPDSKISNVFGEIPIPPPLEPIAC